MVGEPTHKSIWNSFSCCKESEAGWNGWDAGLEDDDDLVFHIILSIHGI